MLDPSDRTVLTESLRPPVGFRVDRVVATTYTLDLVALLTLPMSFTLLAGDGVSDSGRANPIALLEALRRQAGRLHVFCDSGRIAVPRRGQLLFSLLEQSVIEARAPKGGAFHSKLTIVRYTPDPSCQLADGDALPGDGEVRYRLLCGSRNLTFDRCWDTMLVLDGDLAIGRTRAFSRNHPLSRFIRTLPELAVRPLPPALTAHIHEIADELHRVHFEPPEGFDTGKDDVTFWPIGLDGSEVWPFKGCAGRLMVLSPFVDNTFIEKVKGVGEFGALVSRPEELDTVPPAILAGIGECYVLADAADVDVAETDSTPPADDEDSIAVEPSCPALRGLHAKLFVVDSGWNARLWTGSANATSAAFARNVEFLVELRGKKSRFGLDALLGSAGTPDELSHRIRFRDLLIPYRSPTETTPEDPIQRKLERMLEDARRALVDARLISRVAETTRDLNSVFEVRIESIAAGVGTLPRDVECTLRPISLSPDSSVLVLTLSGLLAKFDSLAFESLTGFCAVTLTASVDDRTLSCDFVLSVPLVGGPPDRENLLLLAMLSNRERLLRYLLMLLQGLESALPLQGSGKGGKWSHRGPLGPFGLPLLEPLLRTLSDDPSRLAPVGRLIRDLQATDKGRSLLPAELAALWESVLPLIPKPRTQEQGTDAIR